MMHASTIQLAAAAPLAYHYPTLPTHELVLRLALAGLCGAVVGFEREWRDRTAGFRTHILVCVGAAVFTLVSAYGFSAWYQETANTLRPNVINDPSRVAAQVVSGIGFLGAGAIFQSRGSVKGLTTAASLWAMAAVGMAVGLGSYGIALGSTTLLIFVLVVLRQVSGSIKALHQQERAAVEVQLSKARGVVGVLDAIREHGATLVHVRSSAGTDDQVHRVLAFDADLPPHPGIAELIARLTEVEGVSQVTVMDVDKA